MDNTIEVKSAQNGEGVLCYLVAQTPVWLSGSSQFRITYRNSKGVSWKQSVSLTTSSTPTNIASFIHGTPNGWNNTWFVPLGQDTGIQIVEDISFASPIGWLAALVLFKPLVETKLLEFSAAHEKNILLSDNDLPFIEDNAYLSMITCPSWSISWLAFTGSIRSIILSS
jgi:hypothetical protein